MNTSPPKYKVQINRTTDCYRVQVYDKAVADNPLGALIGSEYPRTLWGARRAAKKLIKRYQKNNKRVNKWEYEL